METKRMRMDGVTVVMVEVEVSNGATEIKISLWLLLENGNSC